MYDCPSCGAGLRYDIEKAALFCDHCGHTQDPYSYEKARDAEESDSFGVNVFICPQCGGEIMTTDVTAAGFCTYCGASTILDSRMREEKRPAQIIPFSRTKKDCCDAYRRFTRLSLFTPKELRDPEYLTRFRGIYMPYWVYRCDYQSTPVMQGTKSYRKRDYIYTNHYDLSCDLDASYDGITYDASSAFDDTLSLSISPFPGDKLKPFTPAFLSGFYADSPDVQAKEYSLYAKMQCETDVMNRLKKEPAFDGFTIEKGRAGAGKSVRNLFAKESEPRCAYLPVWFLTYRKKDRVAYAVMNGATGKMTADLPVDRRRFLLGSLLLALPLFFLLNFLMTFTAKATLLTASLFSVLTLFFYLMEIRAIARKETRADDVGLHSIQKQASLETPPAPKKKKNILPLLLLTILIAALIIISAFFFMGGSISYSVSFGLQKFFGALGLLVSIVLEFLILGGKKNRGSETANRSLLPHTAGSMLAALAACIILILDPANDVFFYGGTILGLAGICCTLLGILSKYNILATRPIPAFTDREGGDDKPERGYALSGLLPFILAIPLAASLLASPYKTLADESDVLYSNPSTGYSVRIDDQEDLLSDSEEKLLRTDMIPLTHYGNAIFVSVRANSSDTESYAQDYYYDRCGNSSGMIFLIDMRNRVLTLQSEGSVYRTINRGYANSITDNVYRYASQGNYYKCASYAFAQAFTLLEGGRITQPMKYICNALLALILALLFNYCYVRILMRQKRPSLSQVMDAAMVSFRTADPQTRFIRTTKEYSPRSSGGGGSRGGGGFGGGGGGFSGGGGSHRF